MKVLTIRLFLKPKLGHSYIYKKKHIWFEDLKSIDDGKMIDSLPISLNYCSKNEIWIVLTSQ